MRRQRNMAQIKEENKTPLKESNEMQISNLSAAEFKTLVIRMLRELFGYFNSIKKKPQAEMKVTLSEIKKTLQGTNSRVDQAENQMNDLENKEEKNIQPEQQEEKRIQKNEDRLRALRNFFKHTTKSTIQKGDKQSIRRRVQNTGCKEAQGT